MNGYCHSGVFREDKIVLVCIPIEQGMQTISKYMIRNISVCGIKYRSMLSLNEEYNGYKY